MIGLGLAGATDDGGIMTALVIGEMEKHVIN